MLVAIDPWRNKVYWMDSLGGEIRNDIEMVVEL